MMPEINKPLTTKDGRTAFIRSIGPRGRLNGEIMTVSGSNPAWWYSDGQAGAGLPTGADLDEKQGPR